MTTASSRSTSTPPGGARPSPPRWARLLRWLMARPARLVAAMVVVPALGLLVLSMPLLLWSGLSRSPDSAYSRYPAPTGGLFEPAPEMAGAFEGGWANKAEGGDDETMALEEAVEMEDLAMEAPPMPSPAQAAAPSAPPPSRPAEAPGAIGGRGGGGGSDGAFGRGGGGNADRAANGAVGRVQGIANIDTTYNGRGADARREIARERTVEQSSLGALFNAEDGVGPALDAVRQTSSLTAADIIANQAQTPRDEARAGRVEIGRRSPPAPAATPPAEPQPSPAVVAAPPADRGGRDASPRLLGFSDAPAEPAVEADDFGAAVDHFEGYDQNEPVEAPPTAASSRFLAERERISGVLTQQAAGYWENTYVPGAVELRELGQRVLPGDRAHRVQPYPQPLDAPERAALSVSVTADRTFANGPTRALVQVGIRATDAVAGRRPALNLAVILDFDDAQTTSETELVEAILRQLARSWEAGDNVSLIVAGRPGGILAEPGRLTWGQATVLAQSLVENDGPRLSILDAWFEALARVQAGSAAALGADMILVVTDGAHRDWGVSLEAQAHRAATDGVVTSVMLVNDLPYDAELSSTALAGQGTLRTVDTTEAAEQAVQAEIDATATTVARAVRLRLRLGPTVRLVDVIGSRRLDAQQAQRVREAEQSIDRRVATALGIRADRGNDEDGIQIVIPAFRAGDTHVILLDVLLTGPGAVLDVRARYKDIVQLRNGETRSALALPPTNVAPGPLQQNVWKNLVGWRITEALRAASDALATQDRDGAVAAITEAIGLVVGMQRHFPTWANDPDLQSDLVMLNAYRQSLQSSSQAVDAAVDSLRFAAWRRQLRVNDADAP